MFRKNLYSFFFIASTICCSFGQDAPQYIRHAPYSRTISDYVFSLHRAEQNIEHLYQTLQHQELNHQRSILSVESLLAEKAQPFFNKVLTTILVEMKREFSQQLEETKKTCSYNNQPLHDQISSLTINKNKTQESLITLKMQIEKVEKECQEMLMAQKNEILQLNELKPSIRHLKNAEIDQKKSIIALKQENTQLHLKVKKLSERLTNQETLFEKRLSALMQKIDHQALEIKELKEQSKCRVQFNEQGIMKKITIDLRSKKTAPPYQDIRKTPAPAVENTSPKITQPPQPQTLEQKEPNAGSCTMDNVLLNSIIAHPIIAKMSKIQNILPEEYQEFQKILLRNITLYCVNFSLDPNINHQDYIDAITYLCRIDCTYLKLSFYEFLLKAYLKNSPEIQNNLLLIFKKSLTKRSELFSKKHETLAVSLIETIDILEERKIENIFFINTLNNIEDVDFFKNHFSGLLTLCKNNNIRNKKCLYLEYLIFCFYLKKYLILYRHNDSQNNKNIIQSLEKLIFYMSAENSANTISAILSKPSTLDATDKEALEVIFKNFERFYLLENKTNFFKKHPLILDKVTGNLERKKWFIRAFMDKSYNGKAGYNKFRIKCLTS
ncbi:MAG: hypothetical protein NEHIOOID_00072 [Holosporales bacterium]